MPVLLLTLILADPLAAARGHLDHGRYEEALDAFAEAAGAEVEAEVVAVAVALGRTRAHLERGELAAAETGLATAMAAHPRSPDLLAARGELRLRRGGYAAALADAEAALAVEPDHLAARWVRVEAWTQTGRVAEAVDGCRWFVRYYNRVQPTDADSLVLVARGSLRYARWKRVSSIFPFVVNDLCPDIETANPEDWRAAFLSGSLLLEKHNEAQGIPDLNRALAKNPRAAVALRALAENALANGNLTTAGERADAALAVDPVLAGALGVKADVALAAGDTAAADAFLTCGLAVNPHEPRLLGRRAAITVLASPPGGNRLTSLLAAVETGTPIAAGTDPLTAVFAAVTAVNPQPGDFLFQLGETLESRRDYPHAAAAYRAAAAVMPELPEPPVATALLAMRGGDLATAGPLLDTAFKADPYNVRVSNMRKVVALLAGYGVVETPHFVVRFDERDRVLGELMAEFLEEEHPRVTGEFGYEPAGRTTVEVFRDHDGADGHAWFSARLVGLPWVHTIGATTGGMIALASPAAGQRFNWATVLRHEFVHVVTLQQTDYRIPHWYTEALAVRSEGFPRPAEWDALLRVRVPAGQLSTLDELNDGFVRPDSNDDRQFAYCQAVLYANHIDATYGPGTHRKLLAAYRDGQPTAAAIAAACGVSASRFEAGYRRFLTATVVALGPTDAPPAADPDTDPETIAATDPDNASAARTLAERALADGDAAAAKRYALRSLHALPTDAAVHRLLATACDALGETARAATARRHAAACDQGS